MSFNIYSEMSVVLSTSSYCVDILDFFFLTRVSSYSHTSFFINLQEYEIANSELFSYFLIVSMSPKYKSEILVSARSSSSNFTRMLVPRFWLGIYSIVTSISKMCLHKMCATFIHNKNNNYIFHIISNQYQVILDLQPFSQQNLLNRKHTSLIYDILKTKEMSIFTDPSCVMIGNGCFLAEQFCIR